MKALVHTKPYEFEYADVADPEPGPQDVLVRVAYVGICGSDLHGYTGESGRRIPPIIMGHEASGWIEAVGTDVPDRPELRPGARACFDSTVYCNACDACQAGRFNRCINRQVLGVSVPGMKRQGCMAELVCLPWWTIVPMPEPLSFERAALIEPVAIAAHAVTIGQVKEGNIVLVIGAGTIGLFLLQVARLAGARRVLVSDPIRSRRFLAAQLGAEVTIDPLEENLHAVVRDESGGQGADIVFEAVGFAPTIRQAVDSARMGGRVVLVGNLAKLVEINPQDLISRELELHGSYASSGEFRTCVDLVAEGHLQVDPLISDVMPLAEGAMAFKRLSQNQENLLKILLKP